MDLPKQKSHSPNVSPTWNAAQISETERNPKLPHEKLRKDGELFLPFRGLPSHKPPLIPLLASSPKTRRHRGAVGLWVDLRLIGPG